MGRKVKDVLVGRGGVVIRRQRRLPSGVVVVMPLKYFAGCGLLLPDEVQRSFRGSRGFRQVAWSDGRPLSPAAHPPRPTASRVERAAPYHGGKAF